MLLHVSVCDHHQGAVYAVCSAHSIYITVDLTQYAATPLHVHNHVFLPNIFNNRNCS